ncbi:protein translocase subunit SecD [bacterium]|nr:MAG: protein translocase subunit SecD [bacterium]
MNRITVKIKQMLAYIYESFRYVIGGIFLILWKAIWFILKPIVAPSGAKSKARMAVISILIITCLAFFYNYSVGFNKTVDKLNKYKYNLAQSENLIMKDKGFDQWLTGWEFHHFYKKDFTLGLDLKGGTHLVYLADLSNVESASYSDAMEGVRDVVERRVNVFGVSEPLVQVSKVSGEHRLIVDLAGVDNVDEAIKMIGETPLLEFKEEKSKEEMDQEAKDAETKNTGEADEGMDDPAFASSEATAGAVDVVATDSEGNAADVEAQINLSENTYIDQFKLTQLSGKQLARAELVFDPQSSQPQVSLEFDGEGTELFADITQRNVGKRVAIFLDGMVISAPNVNEPILSGRAVIQGEFTIEEARQLAQRLNAGALPVPIKLIGQQTVGATLGEISIQKSLKAGMIGLLAVAIFMIFYYKLLGLLAGVALVVYVILSLAIFKMIPVTLTLSGIAGFILSFGMAVDANVLIFERVKEELNKGATLEMSISEGFTKAWPSIRDGNVSTLITCLILWTFASSSVKGFALTLGIGILVSMISAIIVTRKFVDYTILSRISKWTRKVLFFWKPGM